ncbi:helix-turn-helix domain-containing protein [Vibrio parahaemolyticus]|uniref:helix-turn-helix domain-containing protein n=1 Tax=Vibrio parahaemolyticus TaxID=670 RepID=UPI00186A35E0|nr:helix-turn-helix domain-containing protein [Vibrio parahaemolyticus]MBE4074188.1 helix-turn-helix domain-containing protein [Vibrio parahaemolyticus]MCZ6287116.1 helix-turn-helix domain-containing protein [Vibrio parahaemolyticus]MDF4421249.1 helix-turn-helix domain-containing protein [Vibrio parahaemolyticus]MDF4694578.1 helix-turn-helix domain-containing protein [Vibrio parahaemolyticus]
MIIKHHSQLVNACASACIQNISPAEKAVLVSLLSHLNLSHNKAFPSQQRLASITGYCRATVNRSIQKLKSLNLIKISKIERINGIGLRNQYSITNKLLTLLNVVLKAGFGVKSSKSKVPATTTTPQHKTPSQTSLIDAANADFDKHYQSLADTKRSDISVVQALRATLKRGRV